MLSSFQWYRRWRGGRWATVTGLMWGKRWVRVSPECVERVGEDWRKPKETRAPAWESLHREFVKGELRAILRILDDKEPAEHA